MKSRLGKSETRRNEATSKRTFLNKNRAAVRLERKGLVRQRAEERE